MNIGERGTYLEHGARNWPYKLAGPCKGERRPMTAGKQTGYSPEDHVTRDLIVCENRKQTERTENRDPGERGSGASPRDRVFAMFGKPLRPPGALALACKRPSRYQGCDGSRRSARQTDS